MFLRVGRLRLILLCRGLLGVVVMFLRVGRL